MKSSWSKPDQGSKLNAFYKDLFLVSDDTHLGRLRKMFWSVVQKISTNSKEGFETKKFKNLLNGEGSSFSVQLFSKS